MCIRDRYNRENERTILELEPEIKENNRLLAGTKITLGYEQERLKNLHIPKNAYAITPIRGYQASSIDSNQVGDSLRFNDKMEGTSLSGFFENGALDSLRIEGMAKTLYHIFEDSIYQGKNNASGDTIAISFYDNDLNTINIIGGSEGKYIPDTLSDGNEHTVTYKANRIKYHFLNDESDFNGNVNIKHDGTSLDAGFVNVNWKTNMLNALPRIIGDTLSELIPPLIKEAGRDLSLIHISEPTRPY